MASGAIERAEQRAATFPVFRRWLLPAVLVVALAVVVGWLIGIYSDTRMPGHNSAEAGFARDMSVHHAQAVAMSLIVRDRTNDDQIRTLATDILLTQLNEIGVMKGWLDVWDLPPTGNEPVMAWMDHPVTGRMPGMATQDEVEELKTMPVDEMNVQFLQLMIVHHEAGVEMAQELILRSNNSEVRPFAETVVRTQQVEIDLMGQMLDRLGASDGESAPAASPVASPAASPVAGQDGGD